MLDKLICPIGIFDSGVGGLSVLRAIHEELPYESLVYFGDQFHVPYGPRPLEEIRSFSEKIAGFLISKNVKLIVVACNTASAAALIHLRQVFPDIPFVGMEPAVKPAAEFTKSGVVGVLATQSTFQGALYASVVERFAGDVLVLQDTCPGLVTQIEKGELELQQTEHILRSALMPMQEKGIDTVVLGCTHYPFVIPLIRKIVGPDVMVIDPSPAIARQVRRLLQDGANLSALHGNIKMEFFTSGNDIAMQNSLKKLLGMESLVKSMYWRDGQLLPG